MNSFAWQDDDDKENFGVGKEKKIIFAFASLLINCCLSQDGNWVISGFDALGSDTVVGEFFFTTRVKERFFSRELKLVPNGRTASKVKAFKLPTQTARVRICELEMQTRRTHYDDEWSALKQVRSLKEISFEMKQSYYRTSSAT